MYAPVKEYGDMLSHLIFFQTDGFSDNVFPSEMVTICRLTARAGGTEDQIAQTMADRMVEYAQQCMRSKTRVSPFESTYNVPFFKGRLSVYLPSPLGEAAREGMFFRGGVCDFSTPLAYWH